MLCLFLVSVNLLFDKQFATIARPIAKSDQIQNWDESNLCDHQYCTIYSNNLYYATMPMYVLKYCDTSKVKSILPSPGKDIIMQLNMTILS